VDDDKGVGSKEVSVTVALDSRRVAPTTEVNTTRNDLNVSASVNFDPEAARRSLARPGAAIQVAQIPDALNPFFSREEIRTLQRLPAELEKMKNGVMSAGDQIIKVGQGFKDIVNNQAHQIPSDAHFEDRMDAAYHVGMQAYLTIRSGEHLAKTAGNYYEMKDIPGSFILGGAATAGGLDYNGYKDSNKDFHNNKVGRELGLRLAAQNPAIENMSDRELMAYCATKAIEVVNKTDPNWPPGQKYGVVINSRDPDVPRFQDPTNPVVNVTLKMWETGSNLGDAARPFFDGVRGLFK